MFNFATGVYNTPRQASEPDLVELVKGHLSEVYTQEEITDKYLSHPLISQCKDANSTVQKVNLYRYWNMQLMGVPNSQTARLNLAPGAENSIWYKQFSEVVLPFCMNNGVFKRIH